jgi:hypothetical protein
MAFAARVDYWIMEDKNSRQNLTSTPLSHAKGRPRTQLTMALETVGWSYKHKLITYMTAFITQQSAHGPTPLSSALEIVHKT